MKWADNYDNRARIRTCEKKLAKLKKKRKPDQFEIDRAQKRLDEIMARYK